MPAREPRRLLVLTYYFPPCARSGVQRALRLARYLPEHGWEPVFVVPKRARCRGRYDASLARLDYIARARVWRIHDPTPFKESERVFARAARRLWNMCLRPDGLAGWARNAARLGKKIARQEGFSGVFATGFPFSSFIAGADIAKSANLPLFLDYRDPWTGNPSFHQMPRTEARLIEAATRVFCATPGQKEHISSLFGHPEKFRVFFYSYEKRPYSPPPQGRLRIGFGGNPYGDLTPFKTFLRGLALSGQDAEFVSHGALGPGLGGLVRELGLEDRVRFEGFLGKEAYFSFLESCHVILVAQGIPRQTERVVVASKFLDAMSVGRPVLYMGTPGVNWSLVERNRAGICVDREDPEAVAGALRELFSWPREPVSAPGLEARRVMEEFVRNIRE